MSIVRFAVLLLSIMSVAVISCSTGYNPQVYRPILGDWQTERGIVMTIRLTPERNAAAVINMSPGYNSDDIRAKEEILSRIRPLVDGSFTGYFQMPDGLKPVKVKIGLLDRRTLLIAAWDLRNKGKVMKWRRM